jgi:hypothetical protein
MNKSTKSVVGVSLIALAVSIQAAMAAVEVKEHELTGGLSSSSSPNGGGILISGGQTVVLVQGGYAKRLGEIFQLGAKITFVSGSGVTFIQFLAGPTVNFGNFGEGGAFDLQNSFFLRGVAGISSASVASFSNTDFAFEFSLGKRFRLSESISYAPTFAVEKSGSSDALISIMPIGFSLFL